MPDERASDKLKLYALIETEQAHHAREAADAVFKPKQQAAVDEVEAGDAGATVAPAQQPPRTPRVLMVRRLDDPQPAPSEPTAEPRRLARRKHGPEIPPSEYRRIWTLAAYGMTTKEVAEVYGVGTRRIEHIVSKTTRARGANQA
jgi:hypothetical protein